MVLAASAAALVSASSADAHDCQCRFDGQKYDQGATVCMRGKVARCGMVLNNSSWNVVAEACPQARAPRASEFTTSLATSLGVPAPRR